MTNSRTPDRLIRAFLAEGDETLQDRVYDAVRAHIEDSPQRAGSGAWRMPIMNRIVGLGLAAAAVVVAVIIGAQVLGSPGDGFGGPGKEASPTLEPSAAQATPEPTPLASVRSGLPDGPFVVTGPDDPVQVTVEIASPGWRSLPQFDAVDKADDGLDAPESVGGVLLAWGWPSGTAFNVYGDSCQWSTTIPESPATTPEEIAAALAAQADTEATEPVDVTIGGYAGKAITLQVPLSYDIPGATREEKFAACDQGEFGFYGIEGESLPARNAQGAGQVDELWILDVDGSIVILDAAYSPATPADLVEELRAIAASATFEAP